MKKVLTIPAALLLFAGCSESPVHPITPMGVYEVGVYVLEYNGHEYLWVRDGGIIHSESCPCWDAYLNEEIEYD